MLDMLERLHTVPKDRALLAGADLMQSMVLLDQTRPLRDVGNRGKRTPNLTFFVVIGRLDHGFYHGQA